MSTNIQIIPSIGLTGIYKLSSKLDNFYNKTTPYTCKSLRRFDDIINSGEDVYYDYYRPLGLLETDVAVDIENNECIVALTTADNTWIYIPSSVIIEVPDQSGIKYTPLGLYATLGAVDDTYDMLPLKTKMAELIKKYLSHDSDIQIAVIGSSEMISSEQHANIVKVRATNASAGAVSSDGTVVDPGVLIREKAALLNKVAALEAFIISIMPAINAVAPPPPDSVTVVVPTLPVDPGTTADPGTTTTDPGTTTGTVV